MRVMAFVCIHIHTYTRLHIRSTDTYCTRCTQACFSGLCMCLSFLKQVYYSRCVRLSFLKATHSVHSVHSPHSFHSARSDYSMHSVHSTQSMCSFIPSFRSFHLFHAFHPFHSFYALLVPFVHVFCVSFDSVFQCFGQPCSP